MTRVDVDIALIVRDGKVLVCQRRDGDSFGGYWEFPGGKREAGETAEQCLARELEEELAVRVRLIEALKPIEHDYPTMRIRLNPYLCVPDGGGGEPQPLACKSTQWVDPSALSQYTFPPANEELIRQAVERLNEFAGRRG